ncbi:glycosyltransferase family A protein [Enterococcus asini]|uniref:glycosyltransferase family A protein n=1 Tax=Enterococcus asini TaxID=57732 RepID=UPI001E4D639B|nr:glycosyltransferase family A protein [Enterococcus asini]MCD5028423.1 glycosyltransferase family 2 protein [Enterococcus asini]MDT2762706.1 glycosyltransferase family A protein [Enterococcus asini]
MKNEHTFVICAYKKSPYLEDCIASLCNQTVQSRVILYTSTPNDFIQQLCNEYEIEMYTKPGGGIGKDWNNALSFVNTKYATIAHQDDFYLETYAEEVINCFLNHSESLIVYSDYSEWKNGMVIPHNRNLKIKNIMLKAMNIFPRSVFWRNRVLSLGNPICCPAVSYNLAKLDGFTFDEAMKVSLDWKAWYEISQKKGDFRFVDRQLMYHRIHELSETTNSISNNSRTNEDLVMYQLYWPKSVANFLMKFYVKSQETNN